ncbi:MAG: 50S ribosomal protein L23 [Candidatus Paceibacterota bacterium]|jgi:large subunit ribosomal protein L23
MGILGTTKPKKEVEKKDVVVALSSGVERSILKKPHASEKAYGLHKQNQYVFLVEMSANKIMVKEEVQRRYNVKVVDVGILVNKGKVKNYRGRPGKASKFKKAYVTLQEGDKIELE